MHLKTILNRVEKHVGFVYRRVRLNSSSGTVDSIEVYIVPRRGSRPTCPGCNKKRPRYDTRDERKFEFVPLWQIPVYFYYRPRRVDCPLCGILVEVMPWADGKRQITKSYSWFLATWAKRLSWKEVAEIFQTSWDTVFRAVESAVQWGLSHRSLEGISSIGVDELQWKHGQTYLTLVYQIDRNVRRLLWIGQDRKAKTLEAFFDWFEEGRTKALRFICSDMWAPYLKVVASRAGHALHVLDRYHIVANLNKAVDQVRRSEAGELRRRGRPPVLKKSRWLFLRKWSNLKLGQAVKLSELLRINLRTVRAYLLKEELDLLWGYRHPWWAGRFLDAWIAKVMRSRLEPLKKNARTLRRHRELILNWFRAKGALSSGIVEGLNNKARVTTRKAYGFRTYRVLQIALYHALGDLPRPNSTHRFC